MTCKDCVHYEVCEALEKNGISRIYPSLCGCFKDKSKFIELPCKVETADPETLPIVRELREQLSKVTAERDAAIKDLYSVVCNKLEACDFCKNKSIDCDKCAGWVGQEGWEYRGIREGRSDEKV